MIVGCRGAVVEWVSHCSVRFNANVTSLCGLLMDNRRRPPPMEVLEVLVMLQTRDTLRELLRRVICAAAVATSLCACSQTAPTHAIGNTTRASAPQTSDMEEVVISASRGSSPTG